jgi:hypothetical protein
MWFLEGLWSDKKSEYSWTWWLQMQTSCRLRGGTLSLSRYTISAGLNVSSFPHHQQLFSLHKNKNLSPCKLIEIYFISQSPSLTIGFRSNSWDALILSPYLLFLPRYLLPRARTGAYAPPPPPTPPVRPAALAASAAARLRSPTLTHLIGTPPPPPQPGSGGAPAASAPPPSLSLPAPAGEPP